ncbi:hypothetical protein C8J57DRAFT_175536 [Mycena rebaudengoi]|nr:hypothetical protein C8J57DRAFT_175536 [Mycena rebaudengoi]
MSFAPLYLQIAFGAALSPFPIHFCHFPPSQMTNPFSPTALVVFAMRVLCASTQAGSLRNALLRRNASTRHLEVLLDRGRIIFVTQDRGVLVDQDRIAGGTSRHLDDVPTLARRGLASPRAGRWCCQRRVGGRHHLHLPRYDVAYSSCDTTGRLGKSALRSSAPRCGSASHSPGRAGSHLPESGSCGLHRSSRSLVLVHTSHNLDDMPTLPWRVSASPRAGRWCCLAASAARADDTTFTYLRVTIAGTSSVCLRPPT